MPAGIERTISKKELGVLFSILFFGNFKFNSLSVKNLPEKRKEKTTNVVIIKIKNLFVLLVLRKLWNFEFKIMIKNMDTIR